uniref:Ankyrin repeat and SOCS box protein 6-like protein n=1 Tax=Callorhinchus milii TaxID=7868 RepID=V9KR73_CALMI
MSYLHGFRRIIFEYQPLVDEILDVLGLKETPRKEAGDPGDGCAEGGAGCSALPELLAREAESAFYTDAVSYSLLKVAEAGRVSAAEELLSHGADLSFEDPVTYYTSLHVAVLRNQPDMVALLVRRGADINRRDRVHRSSPLDLASEEAERVPCLRRLLELGADVNCVDKTGKSALLHALASSDGIQIHNTHNIRLLLEAGADVKATMSDGDNVFTNLIFLLGETEGREPEETAALRQFCLEATQLLLSHSAEPNACPPEESLVYVCINQYEVHLPLLRALLDSGACCYCPQHGPSCWSGFTLVFERLRVLMNCSDSGITHTDALCRAETALELMVGSTAHPKIPSGWKVIPSAYPVHTEHVLGLYRSLKLMGSSPATLKHLCRVSIKCLLRPVPLDAKVKALPLPDRLKWFLLLENGKGAEEEIQ